MVKISFFKVTYIVIVITQPIKLPSYNFQFACNLLLLQILYIKDNLLLEDTYGEQVSGNQTMTLPIVLIFYQSVVSSLLPFAHSLRGYRQID